MVFITSAKCCKHSLSTSVQIANTKHYRNCTFLTSFPKHWPQQRPGDQKLLMNKQMGLWMMPQAWCQRWRRVRSNTCQKHCPADWTTKGDVLIIIDSNPFFLEFLSFLKLYPKAYIVQRSHSLKCFILKLPTINLPPLSLHAHEPLGQHCIKSLNSISSSY